MTKCSACSAKDCLHQAKRFVVHALFIKRDFVNKRSRLRPKVNPLIYFISTVRYFFDWLVILRGANKTKLLKFQPLTGVALEVERVLVHASNKTGAKEIESKMATHIAYHLEAQRRQRIIDRKQEALQRMIFQKVRKRKPNFTAVIMLEFVPTKATCVKLWLSIYVK